MKLLKIRDVAERLDVTTQRAYELARIGVLPAVKIGRQVRVAPAALDAFIESGGATLPGGWKREPGEGA
jgi:excisionase family DNA binding protein